MFRLTIVSVLIPFAVAQYPTKILGSEPTTIEEYPYQLSVELFGTHICGASIVSPTKALTAAHCTKCQHPLFLTVRAGSTYRGMGGQVIRVASVYVDTTDYNPKTINNDVAILHLQWPFKFGKGVKAIPLVGIGQPPDVHVLGTVTGWGSIYSPQEFQITEQTVPVQLRKVTVPRFSQTQCERAYRSRGINITDRMICFGNIEGGRAPCLGDSGNPLVTDGKLSGIVSWGLGCTSSLFPAVYVDLSSLLLREYIDRLIRN